LGHLALNATTAGSNTAVGHQSSTTNSTGTNNSSLGTNSLRFNTTGVNNTAIGSSALSANIAGGDNTGVGFNTQTGNFSGSVILGACATATADNQFVVGSTCVIAGSVATEVNTSSKVWNVVINGVAQKILLA
jgi:hypothetical protein